ncbi:DUF937 domain-containing protein [Nonomuraea sp. NPDC049152]|uniref:DUF937 domain-containing protein n=1 Tax=Nonomuraea sp. NPDC049152 TaxID=3154350 RepID=UPI003406656C
MTLNDEIFDRLGDPGLERIAGLLGIDTTQARTAVEAAVGTIVGGMAYNTGDSQGAEALRTALDDHVDRDPFSADPSDLEQEGHGILGHVLGRQGSEQVADGISQFAGLNSATVMKLLAALAPIVMSILAERASKQGMDAGAVADDLNKEQSSAPGGMNEVLGGLLGSIFGGGGAAGAGAGGLGDLLGGLLGGPQPSQESSQSREPSQGSSQPPSQDPDQEAQAEAPAPRQRPPQTAGQENTNPDW